MAYTEVYISAALSLCAAHPEGGLFLGWLHDTLVTIHAGPMLAEYDRDEMEKFEAVRECYETAEPTDEWLHLELSRRCWRREYDRRLAEYKDGVIAGLDIFIATAREHCSDNTTGTALVHDFLTILTPCAEAIAGGDVGTRAVLEALLGSYSALNVRCDRMDAEMTMIRFMYTQLTLLMDFTPHTIEELTAAVTDLRVHIGDTLLVSRFFDEFSTLTHLPEKIKQWLEITCIATEDNSAWYRTILYILCVAHGDP